MQVVHWPDKNRDQQTVALCGFIIPKIRRDERYSYKNQDLSKVTAVLENVNCVDCLRLRVKQLNSLIDKTIDRIEHVESLR